MNLTRNSIGGYSSEHFTDSELACKCCGRNLCRPSLILALEALRRELGNNPIIILSGYRCEAHNAATPNAAKNSQHVTGSAADIRVPGLTPIAVMTAADRIGFVGMGIANNFVHVDVRDGFSQVRWAYNAQGETIRYGSQPAELGTEVMA